MSKDATRPLTGRHVLIGVGIAFGLIVAANLTLAVQAIATFPGLETKNSYVASQHFDADRQAQGALGWDVDARIEGDLLRLSFRADGRPVAPVIESAVLGRATHVGDDREPELTFDGRDFTAPVALAAGNWNLRLVARAEDGTARTRAVTTGAALGDGRIEILSGVRAGETVVVDGPGPVADGTPVEVIS